MKKCFVIGLIMALVPGMCPAVYTRISDLTAEKIAKMKKLEKCQGTTKGLKIAGLSTLGLTAVGVAGNIAEAVVLNDYKDKVKQQKTELAKQQELNKSLWDQRSAQVGTTQQPTTSATETINGIKIAMKKPASDKTIALQLAREYSGSETQGKKLGLSEQECTDSYPATLTCTVEGQSYVFQFDLSQEDVKTFDKKQVAISEAKEEYILKSDYANKINASSCSKTSNTVLTCPKNNFYVYNFHFSKLIDADPAQKRTVTTFKGIQLHDVNQARRFIETAHDTGTGLKLDTCEITRKNVSVGGSVQDYLTCKGYYNTQDFEFDDLSESDNKENGTVFNGLKKHFCGGTDVKSETIQCMTKVYYVWNGSKYEAKKSNIAAALAETPLPNTELSNNFGAPKLGVNLSSLSAQPVAQPAAKPATQPAAQPAVQPAAQPAASNQTVNIKISGERPMFGEAGVKGVLTEIQEYSNKNKLLLDPVRDCKQAGNAVTCNGQNNNTYIFTVDSIVEKGVLTKRVEQKAREIKRDSGVLGTPYEK